MLSPPVPCISPRTRAPSAGFYWVDETQKALILASKAAYEKALGKTITTECAPAADYDKYGGVFYYGEDYHRMRRSPGTAWRTHHGAAPIARTARSAHGL